MNCARCGHTNRGASWYCANCGAALADLNVADTVRRSSLPPIVRWSLAASFSALALVAIATAALVALPRLRGGTADGAAAGRPPTTTLKAAGGAPGVPDGRSYAQPDAEGGATPAERASVGPSDDDGSPDAPPRSAGSAPAVDPSSVARATAVPAVPRTARPPDGAAAPALPIARARDAGPVWQVQRTRIPLRLDGWLDDWRSEPVDVGAIAFGQAHWDGPPDLSGQAFAEWDDKWLYLGVRVTDETFSQPGKGSEIYLGDSLEIQVDTDLEGDWEAPTYNGDDWQIGVSPGDFAGLAPEIYVWRPAGRRLPSSRLSARRLADGYTVEAALPWKELGIDPRRTRGLGLALNLGDNDVPEPAQLTMLSNSPQRSWGDPRTFRTMALMGGPPTPAPSPTR